MKSFSSCLRNAYSLRCHYHLSLNYGKFNINVDMLQVCFIRNICSTIDHKKCIACSVDFFMEQYCRGSLLHSSTYRRIDCEQTCSRINQQLIAGGFGSRAFVSCVQNCTVLYAADEDYVLGDFWMLLAQCC